MSKTILKYFIAGCSSQIYRVELGEHSSISFLEAKRVIFKRPLKEKEIEGLYKLIGQIKLPINRAQDQDLDPPLIRPNLKSRLTIKSEVINADFFWNNTDETYLPLVYGHLKNLVEYMDALLPLEELNIYRFIEE